MTRASLHDWIVSARIVTIYFVNLNSTRSAGIIMFPRIISFSLNPNSFIPKARFMINRCKFYYDVQEYNNYLEAHF